MPLLETYQGKRVLITGHTGFKGSWLSEWLLALGAQVSGLALPAPPTQPSLFQQLDLAPRLHHHLERDIRDLPALQRAVNSIRPEFIFHLAAQPLVRLSYEQPVETHTTNILGTVHLLEAVRLANFPCTVIAVTTDKCYENREWLHAYRENDPMGGHDPYSASKGAAELIIASYRRSYFSRPDSPVRLASARAGNVIGGGDWATDRIVPDTIRALQSGQPVLVRNKTATRPWQHVLEPLSGYLLLAATLHHSDNPELRSPFNFGPPLASNRTVAHLVQELLLHWPGGSWQDHSDPNAPHEAHLLNLATDKAHHLLHWQPAWNFPETIARTAHWYRQALADPSSIPALTRQQITDYTSAKQKSPLS